MADAADGYYRRDIIGQHLFVNNKVYSSEANTTCDVSFPTDEVLKRFLLKVDDMLEVPKISQHSFATRDQPEGQRRVPKVFRCKR